MRDSTDGGRALFQAAPGKIYATSILKAARHFWCAAAGSRVRAIADELQKLPEIAAVTVVGGDGSPLGVISRERLFAMLGKNFGREVLGRCAAAEVCEAVPPLDGRAELFAAAGEILGEAAEGGKAPDRKGAGASERFVPLVDAGGGFAGAVSSRDLSDFLSRMTRADIDLAGTLQGRLLAFDDDLECEGWTVDAWSRPAKGVGGDLYFARRLPDGRRFIALADVSGKGVAAALVVSMIWGMMRMHDFGRGLRGLVKELNRAIVQTFHMEKYLTGCFMIFEAESGRLSFADMGHSHAMFIRQGRPRRLRGLKANLPVGIELELEPAIHSVRLEEGDGFLVYSDGIVEQENGRFDEYGEVRIARAAARSFAGGSRLSETLPHDLDLFRGVAPQMDDMSFVLVSRGCRSPSSDAERYRGDSRASAAVR